MTSFTDYTYSGNYIKVLIGQTLTLLKFITCIKLFIEPNKWSSQCSWFSVICIIVHYMAKIGYNSNKKVESTKVHLQKCVRLLCISIVIIWACKEHLLQFLPVSTFIASPTYLMRAKHVRVPMVLSWPTLVDRNGGNLTFSTAWITKCSPAGHFLFWQPSASAVRIFEQLPAPSLLLVA